MCLWATVGTGTPLLAADIPCWLALGWDSCFRSPPRSRRTASAWPTLGSRPPASRCSAHWAAHRRRAVRRPAQPYGRARVDGCGLPGNGGERGGADRVRRGHYLPGRHATAIAIKPVPLRGRGPADAPAGAERRKPGNRGQHRIMRVRESHRYLLELKQLWLHIM